VRGCIATCSTMLCLLRVSPVPPVPEACDKCQALKGIRQVLCAPNDIYLACTSRAPLRQCPSCVDVRGGVSSEPSTYVKVLLERMSLRYILMRALPKRQYGKCTTSPNSPDQSKVFRVSMTFFGLECQHYPHNCLCNVTFSRICSALPACSGRKSQKHSNVFWNHTYIANARCSSEQFESLPILFAKSQALQGIGKHQEPFVINTGLPCAA
jgi:hypothetical protein